MSRAKPTIDQIQDLEIELSQKALKGNNSDINSLSAINGGIETPTHIDFDTLATETDLVGRLLWNDTDGTLNLGLKGGNFVLHLGQQQVQMVTNTTAGFIFAGRVVYITGSQGNRLVVDLAQANTEPTSSKTLGVAAEVLNPSQSGFIVTNGLVRNFNTGLFNEGDALWLSPTVPGLITNVKPTQPNHSVLIGWCIRSHATAGIIYVHIMNGHELDELHDVLITNPQDGQLLAYDSASGLWKNSPISLNNYLPLTGGSLTGRLDITAATSTYALRITQTGSGNALLIEDSTTPDATPVAINGAGEMVIGDTTTTNGVLLTLKGNAVTKSWTPNINLDFIVENNTNAGINIISGAATQGRIYFSDGDAEARGAVIYDHTTDTFSIATSNLTRLSIDGSGIVYLPATYNVTTASMPNVFIDSTGKIFRSTATVPTTADLALKQDTLNSGVNIKTINGQSIVGAGNLDVSGGGGSATSVTGNYNLQTFLGLDTRFFYAKPQYDGASVLEVYGGLAPTVSGTNTVKAMTGLSLASSKIRCAIRSSSSSTTTFCGYRFATTFWRQNNHVGFYLRNIVGRGLGGNTAQHNFFSGLSLISSPTSLTNTDPTSHMYGIGCGTADTNLYVYYGTSSVNWARTDLGPSFPKVITPDEEMIQYEITALKGSDGALTMTIVVTNLLNGATATINVPSIYILHNATLYSRHWMGAGTTTTATFTEINTYSMYSELIY